MTPELRELIFAVVGPLSGGIAVYAAIRADLADLKARLTVVERSLDRAHARIDTVHQQDR